MAAPQTAQPAAPAPRAANPSWLGAGARALITRLRDSFTHTPRALGLVWRSSKLATVGLAGLTGLAVLLPLLIAYVGKGIVDAAVARSTALATRYVLYEFALVAAQALVQRGLVLLRATLGARLSVDINVIILEKALTLELRHFEDTQFYDQLTRARREASSRPLAMVTDTFQLGQNLLTLLGYAALLLSFGPLAVVGLLLSAIPAAVAEMRFSRAAFRLRNWRAPETRRLSYIEYVLANDEHAKEVKLFGLGPLLLARYRTLGETFFHEDQALARKRAVWAYSLSLLGTGAFYACYLVVALGAARGRISLGDMTLYLLAFRQGQQAFQSCLGAIGSMYENNLYMSNLFQFLAIPVSTPPPALPAPAARPGEPTERGIRFEHVGFRYPGQEKWALHDIDLWIPQGQSLALVGHNGAGKTTFIKLLTRLYTPSAGRILLDGRDLAEWDEQALRRRIGVIFQDFNQYQFTVRENVGFGSSAHLEDTARVERAVESGGATELIKGLPGGLTTGLGRWFQGGVELSGGQWQKIALSRAFMREEADILVLDEPTAALDAEAEHQVFTRFRALSRGRTSILISHRFPTVRMADCIVVIEGGELRESGTHDELVARGGRYAELFALQAKGYL
ncbi:MAG TPA: ABC transporter ATP-binding protein [Pseudomonadota bacterium]|nr:ABC transporter ATP-binding protein [Pseudomonadota bacterium]